MPSRRHCRQTGPMYLANVYSLYQLNGAVYSLGRLSSGLKQGLGIGTGKTAARSQSPTQTRRFLGGRHPLCGIGVTSLMARTSMPAVDSARTADSRPEPGPATRTSTVRSPLSTALLAAVKEACCAANGV